MSFFHIAGYRFIALSDLHALRHRFHEACLARHLIGTILLSAEGINMNLAGAQESIVDFKCFLNQDERFRDLVFHETQSDISPYRRLKVKIKKEIITFKMPSIDATAKRAPSLLPETFKQWLDEKRDITVLDTRNDYEVDFGTFDQAIRLPIADFSALPTALPAVDRDKPVVMFCTGGIRCEKAALWMKEAGYSDVYQLDGGILGYFSKVGGAHYHGSCFVFDERVALTPDLRAIV